VERISGIIPIFVFVFILNNTRRQLDAGTNGLTLTLSHSFTHSTLFSHSALLNTRHTVLTLTHPNSALSTHPSSLSSTHYPVPLAQLTTMRQYETQRHEPVQRVTRLLTAKRRPALAGLKLTIINSGKNMPPFEAKTVREGKVVKAKTNCKSKPAAHYAAKPAAKSTSEYPAIMVEAYTPPKVMIAMPMPGE
jgi:hypothetical protein